MGIVFRHQQNASMNGVGAGRRGIGAGMGGVGAGAHGEDEGVHGVGRDLKGFYAYRNTFGADSVWLEIPKEGELAGGLLEELN